MAGSAVLTRPRELFMALVTGVAIANVFMTQSLLSSIAEYFHSAAGAATLVVALTQVGFAAGLIFVVPLGDLMNRRLLVGGSLLLAAIGLAAAALAPTLALLAAAGLAVGLGSVVAQVIVPWAADLAPDASRGRVVGTVMTGLLLGIVLGRTVAALLAQGFGWRSAYLVAAVSTAALIPVIWLWLPCSLPARPQRYLAVLRSVALLVTEEPVLVRRTIYGALSFAAFSAFWATVAFLLSAVYGFGSAAIGLFSLLGIAGAATALITGRLTDRGLAHQLTGGFSVLMAGSALMLVFGHSMALLVIGTLALNVGSVGIHATNQGVIYSLRPGARSRLNSFYMTCFFVGGIVGSAVAGASYQRAGWTATCVIVGITGVAATALWAWETLQRRRSSAEVTAAG
jgi:predicted MFS family arabinose efflux permease